MNRALKLATMVVEGQDGAWELACRIVKEATAHKRRVAAKKAPGRARDRVRSLNEVAAHVDLIRKVMARPGFTCELGRHAAVWIGPDCTIDVHHLEQGQAKARHEKITNMIRACRPCHDAYHMNPRQFVPMVLKWCADNGYPVPNRKIFREARSV